MITLENFYIDAITAVIVILPGSKDVPHIVAYPHDECVSTGTALRGQEAANDMEAG